MSKALLILNPQAGGGRARRVAPAAIAKLRATGSAFDVVETERPGHASELASAARRDGYRAVIAAGGDGTTFEVINGLFPESSTDDTPVVGMLPIGTGNSFMRDFGVTSVDEAVARIAAGATRPCDVLCAHHTAGETYFINLLSVGLTATIGATVNRRFKAFGAAGYVAGVVVETARLDPRPLPYALDDGPLDRRPMVFLSFNNSRYTGGQMLMAPEADPADGLIDVITVGAMGRAELLRTFPRIFAGTHVESPKIDQARAARVTLALDGAVDVMVDGEVIRLEIRSITVLPKAVQVLA